MGGRKRMKDRERWLEKERGRGTEGETIIHNGRNSTNEGKYVGKENREIQ